jgi:tRNA (mo5U34)-methyltransferase
MFDKAVFEFISGLGHSDWSVTLRRLLPQRLQAHGDFDRWQTALASLPEVVPTLVDLNQSAIEIGIEADLASEQHEQLLAQLKQFHPWRKGPFNIFGHYIDTEWRSDWKWDRLVHDITPLSGRKVLDIGCGSGYHCLRMRGAAADFVLGIDPTIVFVMQFLAMQKYIQEHHVAVLPLGIEDLPGDLNCFDTVFSMGILYHRRDPHVHLQELRSCLREAGELVLETLVIDEKHGEVLIPEGRYAQMKNIWSIPSVKTLEKWLDEAGFNKVRCIDVTVTSIEEQRVTDWMQFQSLVDYLDPEDHSKTIEGYPAPTRAILIAEK